MIRQARRLRLFLGLCWRLALVLSVFRFVPLKTLLVRLAKNRTRLNGEERDFVFRWLVRLCTRVTRNPCLVASLSFYAMDDEAAFLLGFDPEIGHFAPHAWIESGGQTFNTAPKIKLERLMRYEPSDEQSLSAL